MGFWLLLVHVQTICTSLQTDNHTNTSLLNFYRPDALPDAQPTVSKHWRQKALKANYVTVEIVTNYVCFTAYRCDILLCDFFVVEGEWKLVVRTSDFVGAGTNARVFVTFYGLKSHSEKLQLTNEDSNPFQQGKEATFRVIMWSRIFIYKYQSLFGYK